MTTRNCRRHPRPLSWQKPVVKLSNHRPSAEELRFAFGRSSLGAVVVASSERGVVAISLGGNPDELLGEIQVRFSAAHLVPGDRHDRAVVKSVVAFIEHPVADLDFELDLRGTRFQRRVWAAVREVPLGHLTTYAEIARRIGSPRAMRAVGSACANAPIAFAIPCHRVGRSDGTFPAAIMGDSERLAIFLAREAAARAAG